MDRKRKIIRIDEERCDGCGACIPNCPEGALQIIDAKARLVSDLFCDGLGACIGHCPQGAIAVEERDAEPYDESRVMDNIVPQGTNTLWAHLQHLKSHGAEAYYQEALAYLRQHGLEIPEEPAQASSHSGCPGSRMMRLQPGREESRPPAAKLASRLANWPIQLKLVPPSAPYFDHARLLIAADCAGFASPDFHQRFLSDRVLVIACPKLDDGEGYVRKLAAIFCQHSVASVTVLHMEVPCCYGLVEMVKAAVQQAGQPVLVQEITLSLQGEILEQAAV